jgi:phosphoglycerate dehydrogenase-like enzyme
MQVIVVADNPTLDRFLTPAERERLNGMATVAWRPDLGPKASEETYAEALRAAQAEIIVSGWGAPKLTQRAWAANPQLKAMIHITGALKGQVEAACIEGGLVVTNWGDVPARSVAEATLMLTLASLRRAAFWHEEMHHARSWRGECNESGRWVPQGLFDRTVGLYGFGAIARHFVELMRPFGLTPLVYTGWITPEEEAEYGVKRVERLETLFETCDVISLHTGMRPDTKHTVNAERLALLRDGSHIINTARGGIIDEAALLVELRNQRLFAALDVFEEEPMAPDHPFRGLPNCILFPHQGGPTADYALRCGRTAVDQVERFIRGEPLPHRITLKQYSRMT